MSGGLTLDGRGSRPPATPHPTPCHQGAGAAHLYLSLVGLGVDGLRPGEARLPWGSWAPQPPNQHKTNPALLGQLVSLGEGGGRGWGLFSAPRRGGGWRRQLAGVLVGAGPWEERGLSELACTPCSLPALPPTLPVLGSPGAHRVCTAWPRSLRMPRGKSTRPTSRHRAPRLQQLRTGRTSMSCHSLRSPCPWPSSPGAQVSDAPPPCGSRWEARGRHGVGVYPLLLGPGGL